MSTESASLVCPNCEAPVNPGVGQCDNCRYLHIGKLKRIGAAVQPKSRNQQVQAPPAQEPGTSPQNDGLVVIGWVTAILVPIVGLIIGVIVSSRDDKRGTPIAITSVAVMVAGVLLWVVLLFAASAHAASEYELNDTRETAYGPLAGGTDYTATFETDNDVDWFIFYIKQYSQMDFSAATVDSKCELLEDELWIDVHDRDGKEINSLGLSIFDENEGEVNHRLVTMNPGRYYLSANARGACEGTRYRFRIDPAGSLTTSRECGEAIVARDTAVPLLADANSDLAKSSESLAAEAANVHKAKKELRRTSQEAQRLKQKVKRLGKRGNRSRKLHRTKRYLREVRSEVKGNMEWLEKAKAKRRPVWQEKRSFEAIAAQHQQTISTADAQIAIYC